MPPSESSETIDDICQYIQETFESCYAANKVLRGKYFWGSYWRYMTSNFCLCILNLCCIECNFVCLLINHYNMCRRYMVVQLV